MDLSITGVLNIESPTAGLTVNKKLDSMIGLPAKCNLASLYFCDELFSFITRRSESEWLTSIESYRGVSFEQIISFGLLAYERVRGFQMLTRHSPESCGYPVFMHKRNCKAGPPLCDWSSSQLDTKFCIVQNHMHKEKSLQGTEMFI